LVDGDGHGRGIEARNMPMQREALRVNRLSGLGFVGSARSDEESTRVSTLVYTLQEKFVEPLG
jgi:hypothetical protein